MNGWIDSHAHIAGEPLSASFDDIKQEALANDVRKICIMCGSLKEIEFALLKAENDPMFDFALGVHPGSVGKIDDKEIDAMMRYLDAPQVKFVGEIGLDYYWDETYKDLQKARFIQQINIANEKQLPIAVHIRSAVEDVMSILTKHPVAQRGILHCFVDKGYEKQALEMGYTLGVGGIFTFKNGQNVRDIVENTPIDQILTETDSPYLAPVPYRGKENRPAYVRYVGEALAKYKGISELSLQDQIWNNYLRLTNKG